MLLLIICLPLFGFFCAAGLGRYVGIKGATLVTNLIMFLNVSLCLLLWKEIGFSGQIQTVLVGKWIQSGDFFVDWSFMCDNLTMAMLLVVNIVSFLVHLYSTDYMASDAHLPRFMSYLSLFTFFMLILVTADNLVCMFLGWEGVGLCSYLLISFWYTRIQANKAAIKALVVNRISDYAFTIGILAVFFVFRNVQFSVVFGLVAPFITKTIFFFNYEVNLLTLICVLLFIGAMGKSAQLGLHTWLPDAMEGPTPVSALIHAATMVTAGIFLVIRCSPIFEYVPNVLAFITFIGSLTAFFSATVGLVQSDIKKVIAYSTCSQLGYMFFVCGLSGYHFGLFHLINHAFFKALLFLSAGAIIHSVANEQDMRKFGGLVKFLPFTFTMLLIGSVSLMGFPFLTGYYSKDLILEFAFTRYTISGTVAYWFGIITAFMTSFYSFRVLYLTFLTSPNGFKPVVKKVHELPKKMAFALLVLCFGSIFLGFFLKNTFLNATGINTEVWGKSIFLLNTHDFNAQATFIPVLIKILPLIFTIAGVSLSFFVNTTTFFHLIFSKLWYTQNFNKIFRFLSNKWYFDVIYNKYINIPLLKISYSIIFKLIDKGILEIFGPFGLWKIIYWSSKQFNKVQTGFVYHYSFIILYSLILITVIFEI